MPVLVTPRLELRPYAPSDRAGFAALVSDPELMAHLGGPAPEPDALFERLLAHEPTRGEIAWGVFPRGTEQLAGHVFLQSLGRESGELGFLLLPRFQGRGFATESARAVLDYAFSELGLVEVHASVDLEHAASQRVLRKAGLSPAGEERDAEGPYLRFRVRSPRLPSVLPFYGSRRPDLFAIERAAMDRPGRVLRALDRRLPRSGRVLDIGAGDGFSAGALASRSRRVVALEPAAGMIDAERPGISWVRGQAEGLPFRAAAFDAAFATWACFFPSQHPIARGVEEAQRVVAPGGLVAIVNNLGGDEFCELSSRDIAEPVAPFQELGFSLEVVDTCFEFETLAQARELLGFFFGQRGREEARRRLSFRVGVFYKQLPA